MNADFLSLDLGFDPTAMVAILLMALVTYFTRIGGYLMMRWVPEGGIVSRWLNAIPGAILVAILAPMIWQAGWLERCALAGVGALAMLGVNPLVSILGGTALVAVGRAYF